MRSDVQYIISILKKQNNTIFKINTHRHTYTNQREKQKGNM